MSHRYNKWEEGQIWTAEMRKEDIVGEKEEKHPIVATVKCELVLLLLEKCVYNERKNIDFGGLS